MDLTTGSRLGPYEIVSRIGAGGMGEVWRATDPRIGRPVAIKILPGSFTSDPDRLNRFEQEARAAGTLNHPNLVTIHELGRHDDAPYIVMELLDGETLRDKLTPPGTRVSQRKAVDYAVQIAQGLSAAHEKGIVHRDLKPENIFITRDGRLKILDFGLAKLKLSPSDAITDSRTAVRVTRPGTVMGTVGYMSPEQVRGQAADHRSDIFSLGVILYEMLAGREAFTGGSAADIMSAILREEPPPLYGSNPDLSPAVERIVQHSLEKNPEERFQSVQDLAFDLAGTASGSDSHIASRDKRNALVRRWGFPLLAAAALAIAVVVGLAVRRPGKAPAFRQITFRRGTVYSARFAPDGQTVVYSARWNGNPLSVFLAALNSPESRLIVSGSRLLAVSPKGEMAIQENPVFRYHLQWIGTLARAPIGGGAPRKLLDRVIDADWSHDGERLAVVRDLGTERRLEFPIGTTLYQTAGWISQFRISPDDEAIAFFDQPQLGDDRGSVAIVDLHGHKTTISRGYETEEGLAWTPDGKEVWFTASTAGVSLKLYAADRRGRGRTILSVPGGVLLHDIAADGRVLMARQTTATIASGVVAGSTSEEDLSWLDQTLVASLSRDGKALLVDEQSEAVGGGYAVGLRQQGTPEVVRLGEGIALSLSPDGKWALARNADRHELSLLPTGAGDTRRINTGGIEPQEGAWFAPDGKSIVFLGKERAGGTRFFAIDMTDDKVRPLTATGRFIGPLWTNPVSPDGDAVVGFEPGVGFSLQHFDGKAPHHLDGIDPNERVLGWAGRGELYIRDPSPVPARLFRYEVATGRRHPWKEILPSDRSAVEVINSIVITPDGRYYAYDYSSVLSDLFIAEGIGR